MYFESSYPLAHAFNPFSVGNFLIWTSFCLTFSYYFDETLNRRRNSSCMPCSGVKLDIEAHSILARFFSFPVKKYYWICLNCIEFKLQLHDAIYRPRFYSKSLIHILSLSNSHNNVASIQKNRGDKSHRVIVALLDYVGVQNSSQNGSQRRFCNKNMVVCFANGVDFEAPAEALNREGYWSDVVRYQRVDFSHRFAVVFKNI